MASRGEGHRVILAWLSLVYTFLTTLFGHLALYYRGHLQPVKTWNPWLLAAPMWSVPIRFVLIEFRELGWMTLRCDVHLTLTLFYVLLGASPIIVAFYRIILVSIFEQQKVDFGRQYLLLHGAHPKPATARISNVMADAAKVNKVPASIELAPPAAANGGNSPNPSPSPPAPAHLTLQLPGASNGGLSGGGGGGGLSPKQSGGIEISPPVSGDAGAMAMSGGGGGGGDTVAVPIRTGGGGLLMVPFQKSDVTRRLTIGVAGCAILAILGVTLFFELNHNHDWSHEYECGYYHEGMYLIVGCLCVAQLFGQHSLYLMVVKHKASMMEVFGIRRALFELLGCVGVTQCAMWVIILLNRSGEYFDRNVFDPWVFTYSVTWVWPLKMVLWPCYLTYSWKRRRGGGTSPHHTNSGSGRDDSLNNSSGGTRTSQGNGSPVAAGKAGGRNNKRVHPLTLPRASGSTIPITGTTARTPGGGAAAGAAELSSARPTRGSIMFGVGSGPGTPQGSGGTPTGSKAMMDRLSIALVKILLDPSAFGKFLQYSQSEFNAESCLFWSGVEQYRREPTVESGVRLFATFLSETAPMQVNVSFQAMSRIRADIAPLLARMKNGGSGGADDTESLADPTLFDVPQREIFLMMRSDIFPRFRTSKLGQSCAELWSAGMRGDDAALLLTEKKTGGGDSGPGTPVVGPAAGGTVITIAPLTPGATGGAGGGGGGGSTPLLGATPAPPTISSAAPGAAAVPGRTMTPEFLAVARRMTSGLKLSPLLAGGGSPIVVPAATPSPTTGAAGASVVVIDSNTPTRAANRRTLPNSGGGVGGVATNGANGSPRTGLTGRRSLIANAAMQMMVTSTHAPGHAGGPPVTPSHAAAAAAGAGATNTAATPAPVVVAVTAPVPAPTVLIPPALTPPVDSVPTSPLPEPATEVVVAPASPVNGVVTPPLS